MSALKTINLLLFQAIQAEAGSIDPTRFYKMKPGDYAEHDQFIGVPVATLRRIARQFEDLNQQELEELIISPINEERLLALFLLTHQFQLGDELVRHNIYQFYCHHLKYINNWNLVDASAHLILGAYLYSADKEILLTLVRSPSMWERRIAIVSTWYFIRKNDYLWTINLAKILLQDSHDLIHKSVGWMLREVGKRDKSVLLEFLKHNATVMPRTMLRYAIEKFPSEERKFYLQLKNQCATKPPVV